MACDRYEEWLADWALGALPAGNARELQAHLWHCANCRKQLEQEQRRFEVIERSIVGRLAASPSSGFEERLLARLARESNRSPLPVVPWIPAGAVALAAALALALALWVIPSPKHRAVGPRTANNRFTVAPGSSAALRRIPLPYGRGSASVGAAHMIPSRDRKGAVARLEGLGSAGLNPKSQIPNPNFQRSAARKDDRGDNSVAAISNRGYALRAPMAGPDLRVIVEPGQWAAVVQFYNAVWSGRVNGKELVTKSTGSIKISPIEISQLKVVSSEPADPNRGPAGPRDPANTNRPDRATL